MPITRRILCQSLSIGLLGVAATSRGYAQVAPTLKLVVGFPPGGSVDVAARQLGESLRASGYTVVVENKAGAAGKLAVDAVRSAVPNGETLMVAPNSVLAMEAALYAKPRYEFFTEFAPVSAISQNAQALAVGAGIPVRTLAEFLVWCRQHPDKASYATPGQGTPFQFLGTELAKLANTPMTHVPYRGGSQALPDVISGQVASFFSTVPNLAPFHRRGQLRMLALTAPQRIPSFADIPTFAELGYPALTDMDQFGLFAPIKTPTDVLTRLSRDVAAAVNAPALREAFAKIEFEATSSTPQEHLARMRETAARWDALIKKSGFQPNA